VTLIYQRFTGFTVHERLWYWSRRRSRCGSVRGGSFIIAARWRGHRKHVTYQSFTLLLAFYCWPGKQFFFRATFPRRALRASARPDSAATIAAGKKSDGENQTGLTLLKNSPTRARLFRNGWRFNWLKQTRPPFA